MPIIMPAMIDSHGKPGIGGKVIGVETEIELEVDVAVVGVLMAAVVAELTPLVWDELVVLVTGIEDVELVTLPALVALEVETMLVTLLATLVLVGVGVDDVDAVAYTPPGGSRWNIIPSEAILLLVMELTP